MTIDDVIVQYTAETEKNIAISNYLKEEINGKKYLHPYEIRKLKENIDKCLESAEEYKQIVEWLNELKFYRNMFDFLKKDFENKLLYGEVGESK